MTYSLAFHPEALKEWRKLDETLKAQFKKKLRERMAHPRVPQAALSGGRDLYKIKLKASGYRLIYRVEEARIMILVLSVGKREGDEVYKKLQSRIS